MPDKPIRAGIFTPSYTLRERVEAIAARHPIQATISRQGLEDAVDTAASMGERGVEVIVSGRATAEVLREHIAIPVIAFPHRSLDILSSLKQARAIGRRLLLPVFRREMDGVALIEDMLGIELVQAVYTDHAGLQQAIRQAKRRGCQVVVGGGLVQRAAQAAGLTYVEIRVSDEDLAATLQDACSIAMAGREQKAVARRYQAIIDAASEGIVAVDPAGRVTTINAAALRALRTSQESALGRPIAHLLPGCSSTEVLIGKKPLHDRLGQIQGSSYIFSHLPVMLDDEAIGAVLAFCDTRHVMRTENVVRRSLASGFVARYDLNELIHASPVMGERIRLGQQYAKTDSTILLTGETGTGKEIFAHGIHRLSRRSRQPFVSVNCAALSEQLLESELFGYEEGAFTGSRKGGKAGRFEIAHQGTIFLDEIDSTPPPVQIRLLRVLQEREVIRVGGDRKLPVDVRVIAAASRPLSGAVQEGGFRADLYFRLNVLSLEIPPLRERPEDIAVLLEFFIRKFSDIHGLEPVPLPAAYRQRVLGCGWPGNVRQLRNFAERLVMNASLGGGGDVWQALCDELTPCAAPAPAEGATPASAAGLRDRVRQRARQSERQLIVEALERARFNKSKAAVQLGVSRTTLWRKIRQMGLE
jgi:transcriptional regulator with PAS, ATPase and Fis domain